MKNIINPIWEFIDKLTNIRTQYKNIKQNEESKKISTYLGKKSLLYTLVFVIMIAFAGVLGVWAIKNFATVAMLFAICALIIALYSLLYALFFFILALSASIKQLKVNKKPIGFVALFLTLALLVVAIIVLLKVLAM